MTTLFIVLGIWFVASLVFGILFGKAIKYGME